MKGLIGRVSEYPDARRLEPALDVLEEFEKIQALSPTRNATSTYGSARPRTASGFSVTRMLRAPCAPAGLLHNLKWREPTWVIMPSGA